MTHTITVGHSGSPEPFRPEIVDDKRALAGLNALIGATSTAAPDAHQYLLMAKAAIDHGDYGDAKDFLAEAGKHTTPQTSRLGADIQNMVIDPLEGKGIVETRREKQEAPKTPHFNVAAKLKGLIGL